MGIRQTALVTALGGFARGTRSYLVVSTVFGLIVAVLDGLFLWFVGVPLALLWGLLAFVTNYIPNVGFIIGLAPPAVLSLLQGGPRLMITVIVAYCVINFVFQSVIQPKWRSMGRKSPIGAGSQFAATCSVADGDRDAAAAPTPRRACGRPPSQVSADRAFVRRSTATSWRSTRISTSLTASERASSASQLSTRASIR